MDIVFIVIWFLCGVSGGLYVMRDEDLTFGHIVGILIGSITGPTIWIGCLLCRYDGKVLIRKKIK